MSTQASTAARAGDLEASWSERSRRLAATPRRLDGLSIVLPCFNERDNLRPMIRDVGVAARAFSGRHEIIVIDDGSDDGSAALADDLRRSIPELRVIQHGRNRGYGAALRSGIAAARHDWVLLTDADRQFDLMQLDRFVPRTAHADLILGHRVSRADPIGRRAAAAAWNKLVGRLFHVPARDVDCAFKLVRREAVERVRLTAEGAMISTELVVRCAQSGAAICEVGVDHHPRPAGTQSGTNPRVVARAFCELARLHRSLAD